MISKKKIKFMHSNASAENWLVYWQFERLLLANLPTIKGVVYDLGCGEKPYEKILRTNATAYIGIDWSATLHKLNADIVADLNQPLPVDSNSADTVVSFSVIEHLAKPGVMLKEAFRILKPSGNLIIQVPFMWWIHEAPWDYQRWTTFGLKLALEEAGFSDVEVKPTGGFFTMMVMKLNYFSARYVSSTFRRLLLRPLLVPIWTVLQLMALPLDRLDRHPELEAPGYWVTARKK